MRRSVLSAAIACGTCFAGFGALAQAPAPAPASAPAPLGVFGVDMPNAGGFVFSLLPSFIRNQGSQIGTASVSPQYIISHVTSPDTPVGNHLLRLVPEKISVETQSISLAYGLTDSVTLSAATTVVEKSVTMQSFKGLTGSTILGDSVGSTQGLGDSVIATIIRVYQDPINRVSVNMGLSLPTGSITDTMSLLLPSNTFPEKRGFYAMQAGTGTFDAMPGIAYSGVLDAWSWGLSYRARLPVANNGDGWRYGDLHELNAWGGYSWIPGLETTLRLNGTTQGAIEGNDPQIRGYAQGSNPAFYGGRQLSVFGGMIVSGRYFHLPSATVGVEAGVPVYQSLNGPQLARDWQVNLALRYKF